MRQPTHPLIYWWLMLLAVIATVWPLYTAAYVRITLCPLVLLHVCSMLWQGIQIALRWLTGRHDANV